MTEDMVDDPLDEKLSEAARSYHEPPETPREEIWAGMQAKRRKGEERGKHGILPFRPSAIPPSRLVWWSTGVAALIALGVGIGRLTAPQKQAEVGPAISSVGTVSGVPSNRLSVTMALAAIQHLTRAEALLTGFRAESRDRTAMGGFSGGARELLSTTRLLLDSPDLKDPGMRALLQDLELVLAQITQLRGGQGTDEVDLITEGLNQRGLLPRLRSAIPAGPAALRAQGEL